MKHDNHHVLKTVVKKVKYLKFCHGPQIRLYEFRDLLHWSQITIGLMQKYPPIFKKMFLNDVALLWMRGFHAYVTASVS